MNEANGTRTKPAETDADAMGVRGVIAAVAAAASEKGLSHLAAGVAFYMLFSLFPAMAFGVTVAALVFDAAEILELIDSLGPLMPEGVFSLIRTQVAATLAEGAPSLQAAALISLALSFWSAGAAVRALITAMRLAFPASRRFGLLGFYALSFALTLFAVAAVLAALLVLLLLPLLFSGLRLVSEEIIQSGALPAEAFGATLQWDRLLTLARSLPAVAEIPALLLIGAAALTVLYRLGAARGPRAWAAAWRAGLSATVLWVIGTQALGLYLGAFGDLAKTYGPLGAVAGLMLWFWVSAFALLLGAEVAAALSRSGGASVREETGPASDEGARPD